MQSAVIAAKNPTASQQQALSLLSNRRIVHAPVACGKPANLLTPVFQNRRLTSLLLLAAVVQTGLVAAGMTAWMCPLKNAFSIPCPACGMTTGVVHLLRGQWISALQAHLFSPLLLAAMAVAGVGVMLPASVNRRLITRVERLERSTGAGMWMVVGLGVFWIWRLAAGI